MVLPSSRNRHFYMLTICCCVTINILFRNGATIVSSFETSIVKNNRHPIIGKHYSNTKGMIFVTTTKSDADNNNLPGTTVAPESVINRRTLFQIGAATATAAVVGLSPNNAAVAASVPVSDMTSLSLISDLPPDAIRSYLQYRLPLQISIDYYIFELQDKIMDVNQWGDISELFNGNPTTKLEREFTNIFRIVGLSMPPDTSDSIRDAQFKFERSMGILKSIVYGIRRDLPVEIDKNAIPNALLAWDNGRIALNEFSSILNSITVTNELSIIPPPGPNQYTQYKRSSSRYINLKKKLKLCQNRGGPTLSNTWGTLMVSGYLQDSCGIPDLDSYFNQQNI